MKKLTLRHLLLWCLLTPMVIGCDRVVDVQPSNFSKRAARIALLAPIDQQCPTATRWETLLCLPTRGFHGTKAGMIADHIDQIQAADLGSNPDVCYNREDGNLIFKSRVNNNTVVTSTNKDVYSECQ